MALARCPQEIFALQSFQRIVDDLRLDQGTMMRFLRARNLDLSNAEEMLRAYAHWKLNNIYEPALDGWKPPRQFLVKFEAFRCGTDRDGRPVFYIHFDKWMPSRPLFEEFEPFDMMLFAYKTFLVLYDDVLKSQHQQVVAILDNEDIGFTKIFHEIQHWKGVQTLIDIWQLYEANFPETLHKAFFINTARAFMWGFNLVKPFMTKHTLSKISIFGTDEDKWKPAMHECLPANAIPEKFGGSATLTHVYEIVYDGIMKTISEISDTSNNN